MDENLICSNFEACLQFIYFKFDYYKKILDDEQQICDTMINNIRDQANLYNNDDDKLRSITGFDRISLTNQLDYFEQEAFKTYEENKTCLFKMFQNLFNLHREFAFDEVITNERQIAELFQYRPSLLPNIEKIRFPNQSVINNTDKNRLTFAATPTPKTILPTQNRSVSFSNRAGIQEFQQKKDTTTTTTVTSKIIQPIESNEIDLTKYIRDTYQTNTSEQFKFSNVSKNLQQQQQQSKSTSPKKLPQQTIPCNDALLIGANKRYVLLYNMNITNMFFVFDIQKDETKEFQWDEGCILSLGHADSNQFYMITSTKIFLYDIIKENIIKQYFLYDTLYKDLFQITDDLSYKTCLKRNNQIQSIVYDDYCYYLYPTKEYNQILIKCSLDNFQQESNLNLTKQYPYIEYFLSFTITSKSLIAFLIQHSNTYELLFCDELHNYNIIKKLPINNSIDPTKIVSTYLSNITMISSQKGKTKTIKSGKQIWFILDTKLNCIHCFIHENYLTKIESLNKKTSIQSISIYDNKLILAYNELSVEIIDLDNYFSSLQL